MTHRLSRQGPVASAGSARSLSGVEGIILAVVGVLLCVNAASAQLAGRVGDVVESIGQSGTADWTKNIVTATGIGAPPPNAVNAAQAKAMAKRAAKLDALRNLLEAVKGVRVDSATLVENFITQSDVIKTEVSGFIQGAQVMKEQVNADGSVETVVGMKLTGDLLNTLMPRETGGGAPIVAPFPSPQAPSVQPLPGAPTGAIYTGLIVDAKGLGIRPAMVPKIRNEEGREVYGSAFVNREYAVQQGMVGYLKDLSAAQSNERVTNRPLLVKALRTDGPNKTDLIISNQDAQVLHGMKENLNFLERARVMVVVD